MDIETKQKDLAGRPVLSGGSSGEQMQFLKPEDYKTMKERERINSQNDIKDQLKLF